MLEINIMYCVYFKYPQFSSESIELKWKLRLILLMSFKLYVFIISFGIAEIDIKLIVFCLYCIIWIPCVWSFSVLTIGSVNTSRIQISQDYLYLAFLISVSLFSSKKYLKFHCHSKSRRAFSKKCQISN